ncbi:MAG: hypothetical protein OXH69_18750 [Acidobacteria bacterium]|nr:hypothetical protein [Acidobacteriota bacterium]
MLRSLSRAQCALASSLPARRPIEPSAKCSARAERRRSHRQTTYRTDRRGVTRRTDKRPRRR